jgi:hypothetical protein
MRMRIRDQGIFYDPGSGMEKIPDPGSVTLLICGEQKERKFLSSEYQSSLI